MQSDTIPNDFEAGAAGGPRSNDAELEVQVANLRSDVAGIAETLKSMASERADGAKRQAFALRDDVRDRGEQYVRQAKDAVSDIEEQVSEQVRAEPIKAVIVAAAIGYLYARIFH